MFFDKLNKKCNLHENTHYKVDYMAYEYLSSSLATNSVGSENGHNEASTHAENTHHKEVDASAHGAANEHAEGKQDVFSQIFAELGDHPGLYIGPMHITDLPVILVDNGLHIYSSPQSMKEAGLFTTHGHGKIVRTSDGQSPALDLSITNLVVFQWIGILLLLFIFGLVGRKYKKNPISAPKGLQNVIEMGYLYVRDEIVRPNIPGVKTADKLLPYFIGLFFFILILNLIGLLPGGHTATGAVPVTAALAISAFLVVNITAVLVSGIGAWFKHLLGGAPWWLFFIMIPIEVAGLFIKPFALTVRLFANMTAGHAVLFSLLGLIFYFKNLYISPAVTGVSLFVYSLELLVCFLQAYIFTMLTSIFVGLAIGDHGHEEHGHHA